MRARLLHDQMALGYRTVDDMQHLATLHRLRLHATTDVGQRTNRRDDRLAIKRIEHDIDMLKRPVAHRAVKIQFHERSIAEVVLIIRHLIDRLRDLGSHQALKDLHGSIEAFTRTTQTDITDDIRIDQVFAELLQPAEKVVIDTLEITQTALQMVVRIRLQAIDDIHVWGIRTNRRQLDDTLTFRIRQVINAAEGVVLLNQGSRSTILHRRRKCSELHPVEAIAILINLPTGTNLRNPQFVTLDDIAVTTARHIIARLVLLHHDTVTDAKRHHELTAIRIQPDLTSGRIIMMYLFHCSDDPVIILTQQLGHNELIDSQRATDIRTVALQDIFILNLTGSVSELLLLDRPASTAGEAAEEVGAGETAGINRVTSHLQGRKHPAEFIHMASTVAKFGELTHPKLLQFGNTLFSDLTTFQAFSILTEEDGTQRCESFQERRVVQDLIKSDFVEFTDLSKPQQLEERRTDAKSSIRMQTVLITNTDKGFL